MKHYKVNIPVPTLIQMAQQKDTKHTIGYDDFDKVYVTVCIYIYIYRPRRNIQESTLKANWSVKLIAVWSEQ
jgi:hypothetical protein